MPCEIFVRFPGIEGEVRERGLQATLPVESIEFGAQNPATLQGEQHSAGKPALETFRLVKRVDWTSPMLLERMAAGQPFPQVTVSIRQKATPGQPEPPPVFLRYTLHHAYIVQRAVGGEPGGDAAAPAETLELAFAAIKEEFIPLDPATKRPGTPISWNWSQVKEQAGLDTTP